ncbi:MAG: nucleotide disphospho-sugar-binding domain-containing protein [Propionibacteriaceae bacterium]
MRRSERRSHYLLVSTPIYGHVAPMLTIGRGLVARGHRVTLLSGRKYRNAVEAADLTFLPLPAEVDYDDAALDSWLPDRDRYRGLASGRYDIIGMFVRPLAAQHRVFEQALETDDYDAVLCETAFLGVLPTLLTVPTGDRIPIFGVSVTPLSLTSVDCAPFGSGLDPGHTPHTRRRNRLLNTVLHRGPLRPIQTALDQALADVGAPPATAGYFDQATMFDLTYQLAVPGIEYPRREMPATIQLIGPLWPDIARDSVLPLWWADLYGSRPVVHVTQGTMDNVDLAKVLAPTLRGLAREDVLVVASTGGQPVRRLVDLLGTLPDNARLAEFLPYDRLLPLTDLVVTNGGFGGVQQALSHGVPLVVAGATEDKPEVAARVAWSGSGVNLRTGSPSAGRVRGAVRTVLGDPRYRVAAQGLQRQILEHGNPLDTIIAGLESLPTTEEAVALVDRASA